MDSNELDVVWKRLKVKADEWAHSDLPLPDRDVCAEEVRRIVHDVFGRDAVIPQGALSFYADEMLGFVQQYRALRVGVRIFSDAQE